MKKTLRRRTFISAIAMLIVSAIVLTSSTFAWFSMAKKVEVESMELNITSPDGVQLSANTSAFTTMLTVADIKGESGARWSAYESNQNNFPELLSPASSAMLCTNSLPKFYTGSIDDTGKLNISAVTSDVNSGYVAFDIFVKLGQDQKVFWDQTTVTCDDNPDTITAMRVALVNCGTVDPKAEADEILTKFPQNSYQNRVVMFEPDSYNHTDDSKYEDGATVTDVYLNKEVSGLTPNGNGQNITTHGSYTIAAPCERSTEADTSNSWFDGLAGINRVRVYLWMEGNDVDCENSVAGSSIDFNLVLTIA